MRPISTIPALFCLACITLACTRAFDLAPERVDASEAAQQSEPEATPAPRATADLQALVDHEPSEAELLQALSFLISEASDQDDQDEQVDRRTTDKRRGGEWTTSEKHREDADPPVPEPPERPALLEELGYLEPEVLRSLLVSKSAESLYDTPKGINGAIDDRYDPTKLRDTVITDPVKAAVRDADLAASRSVALMISADATADGRLILPPAGTLGDRQKLCAGQRFANEPSYEGCSAVLVAPDIVATAGHCVDPNAVGTYWFVFNYVNGMNASPGVLVPRADAYRGQRLIELSGQDWALIQLDRPVVGHEPVVIRPPKNNPARAYLTLGEYVFAAGHPDGIPLKIVQSGRILALSETRFVTNLDLFLGNSGSPIFDRDGVSRRMIGLVVSGRPDYTQRGNCWVVAHCLPGDCPPREYAIRADLLLPHLP